MHSRSFNKLVQLGSLNLKFLTRRLDLLHGEHGIWIPGFITSYLQHIGAADPQSGFAHAGHLSHAIILIFSLIFIFSLN